MSTSALVDTSPTAIADTGPVAGPQAEAQTRPGPRNVVEAIVEVMRLVRAVGKDGYNKQSDYNFRGVDSTVNNLGPAMRDIGLVVIPGRVRDYTYGEIEIGKNRTKQAHAKVGVTYRFMFSNGQGELSELEVEVVGEAMDSGDKATAKAMSVAFRTCLLQSFALPTQERDPDADTYERSPVLRVEEIREAVDQSRAERDPQGWLARWANNIGEGRLRGVEFDHKGEWITGHDYVCRILAYYQQQAEAARAALAAEAAAAQAAHEGATSDIRADAAGEASAPAEPAGAAQGQEPSNDTASGTQEEQPAPHAPADRAGDTAAEQAPPRSAETLNVLAELVFQAEILGVQPDKHAGPALNRCRITTLREAGDAHVMKLGEFLVAQRARVAEAMLAQGNASSAAVYRGLPQRSAATAQVLATLRTGGATPDAVRPSTVAQRRE